MELLHAMAVFVKLAEVGSFTRAAEALDLNRPQATLAIQELERNLGARLLHRTTRKVRLTSEGELFYERARGILADVAAASTMFGRSGDTIRGRLRIDLPSALGQQFFLDALSGFSEDFPGVELSLGVTDRLVDLVAEGIDCTLRIGELADSSLVGRRIGALRMVTCAAPAYLERMGTPDSLEALASHRGVSFQSGLNRRPMPWQFMEDGVEKLLLPLGRIGVNEANAYLQCGLAGFGIIQLPGVMVDARLKDGSLVELLSRFRPQAKAVSLLYPTRTHIPPQVSAFAEWLAPRFADLQPSWLES